MHGGRGGGRVAIEGLDEADADLLTPLIPGRGGNPGTELAARIERSGEHLDLPTVGVARNFFGTAPVIDRDVGDPKESARARIRQAADASPLFSSLPALPSPAAPHSSSRGTCPGRRLFLPTALIVRAYLFAFWDGRQSMARAIEPAHALLEELQIL